MAAKSPVAKSTDLLNVVVKTTKEVSGAKLISIEVCKEINKIPYAKVTIADGDVMTSKFELSEGKLLIPGTKIEISAGFGTGATKPVFKGIIVEHSIQIRPEIREEPVLVVKCYDAALAMTIGRKNAYYLEKNDKQIIEEIIGNTSGLTKAVGKATLVHKQVTQYQVSDWDFMLSRADLNGFVVVTEGGKVTADIPKVSETPKLVVTFGKDILRFEGNVDSKSQLAKVTCNSWDPAKQVIVTASSKEPKVPKISNLKGKKMSDVVSPKEVIMHSSVPIVKKSLENWASSRLQRSRLSMIRGKVTFQGSADAIVGETIELAGVGKRFIGNAYISKVEHRFSRSTWLTTVHFGLPSDPYAEMRRELESVRGGGWTPPVSGLQIGTVKQVHEDPDGEFRILVEIPMVAKASKGVWARLSNFYATKTGGAFFFPEAEDEVILGFLNDDPSYPIVLGVLYSKTITPPKTIAGKNAPDKDNMIKGFITKTGMRLEFDEKDKVLTLETKKGNQLIMSEKDKKVSLIDQNGNSVVLSDKGIALDTKKDVTITAGGKISLTAKKDIELKATGDVKAEGNNVGIKGKMDVTAEGTTANLKASGNTVVKGAIVMIN